MSSLNENILLLFSVMISILACVLFLVFVNKQYYKSKREIKENKPQYSLLNSNVAKFVMLKNEAEPIDKVINLNKDIMLKYFENNSEKWI